MSTWVDTNTKSFPVGSTALAQYTRVKLSSGELIPAVAADGAITLGVVCNRAEADAESAAVMLRSKTGTMPMIANNAIAVGGTVYTAAAGKVSATATSATIVGIALTASSADGDMIEVLLTEKA